MDRIYSIQEIKEKISEIAKQYGVRRAYLFGSYARGDAKADSDIDICIEEGNPLSLLDFSGFYLDLKESLNHEVDVVSAGGIKGSLKQNIEKEKVLVYG